MLTVLLALTPTGFAPSAATLQRHATISRTSQVSCAMDIAQIATMINTNEQLLIAGVVALGAMGAVTFKTEPVTEAEKRAHSERIATLKREGAATVAHREMVILAASTPKEKSVVGMVMPTSTSTVDVEFDRMDKDGSGSLDIEEVREALSDAGQPADEQAVRATMEALDTNRDGVVSREEFKSAVISVGGADKWWDTSPRC